MSELSTLEREQLYSIDIYPKRELTVVRGEGAHVYDDTGREFIDCAAGIGVASVGHANPAVAKAVAEQASKLIRAPAYFITMFVRLSWKSWSASHPKASNGHSCVTQALRPSRLR